MKVWFQPFEKTLTTVIARIQGQRSSGGGLLSCTSLERLCRSMEGIPPVSHTLYNRILLNCPFFFLIHISQPAKRAKHQGTLLANTQVSSAPGSGLVSASSLTSIQDLCHNIHRLEVREIK